MKRNYEVAEFANYFFHCMKAFILYHEISHHILKHTKGISSKAFKVDDITVFIEVDERAIAQEFEADDYGHTLLRALIDTTDESVFYAYCKYRFDFAPVFLFDIFLHLDTMREKRQKQQIVYNDHPHPSIRGEALKTRWEASTPVDLYDMLKSSLDRYLGDGAG